jgi:uncharacterized protein YoxC
MFKIAAGVWVIILAVGLLLSLGFNAAVVGFASVSKAVAGIYDAVTGTESAVTKLRGQRDRLTRDISAKEGRIAQLTDDIAIRDARIASFSDEIADLRRTVSVTYRGERRPLREAITDTNQRFARRTAVKWHRPLDAF